MIVFPRGFDLLEFAPLFALPGCETFGTPDPSHGEAVPPAT